MLLIKGSSSKAFSKNVKTEMDAGKPQKQSLEIAYDMKRRNKRKPVQKFVEGGAVLSSMQDVFGGGSSSPSRSGSGSSAPSSSNNGSSSSASSPTSKTVKPDPHTEDQHLPSSPSVDLDEQKSQNWANEAEGGEIMKPKMQMKKSPRMVASSIIKPRIMNAQGGYIQDEDENGQEQLHKNEGNKASKNDDWSSDVTIKQAQKPSPTKLSQPKLKGSDAFSGRNRQMRDDENDLGDSIYPETDKAQPIQRDNEYDAVKSGNKVPDMERQHNNKKAPYQQNSESQYAQDEASADMKKKQSPLGRYAKGGPIMQPKDNHDELEERMDEGDLMDSLSPSGPHNKQPQKWRNELDADSSNPNALDMEREHSNGRKPYADGGMLDDEMEEERHDSIAAAIMAKRDRMHAMIDSGAMDEDNAVHGYADGGQVDLDLNSMEQPNAYYPRNEDEVLKENYDSDFKDVSQPEDSNEKGDDIDSDSHDHIDEMRRRMKSRRQF
jgi:hypothetical protein